MNLFLFSNFFPLKKAEPFLINEFDFIKKYANTITLITLYGKLSDTLISGISDINQLQPVLSNNLNKKTIFFKGIFNLAPFNFHLLEFFSKGIFFSLKKTRWFLTSLLVTRTILSSKSYKEVIKLLNTSKSPVLYFYWGDNFAWIIPYLKNQLKNKKIKIILRLHGSDLYENLKNEYAPLRNIIFFNTDLIVPISEHGKNYISEKYPEFKSKIFLSYLGVFDNGLNPINSKEINQFHIVSVSNVIALKRLHLIYETLQKTNSNITWHHFGDGPLANSVKNIIKSSRMGLNVNIHGHIPNSEIIQFYKTQPVNLFINVSSSEGIPVSIMEALSFGIPVIATNVGGVSELINDDLGGLIEANFNTNDLALKIEKILHLDNNEFKLLRENARKVFDKKVNATDNYNCFYKKINPA